MTRAQVQQELAAARANGELVSGEEGYAVATFAQTGDKTAPPRSSKSWLRPVQGLTDSGELDYPPVRG